MWFKESRKRKSDRTPFADLLLRHPERHQVISFVAIGNQKKSTEEKEVLGVVFRALSSPFFSNLADLPWSSLPCFKGFPFAFQAMFFFFRGSLLSMEFRSSARMKIHVFWVWFCLPVPREQGKQDQGSVGSVRQGQREEHPENTLKIPWNPWKTLKYPENSLKTPWNYPEIPWKYTGNTLKTLWKLSENTLKIPWNSLRTPWKHPDFQHFFLVPFVGICPLHLSNSGCCCARLPGSLRWSPSLWISEDGQTICPRQDTRRTAAAATSSVRFIREK